MVVYASNPSTWEDGAGRQQVIRDQPELHSQTMSQKTEPNTSKRKTLLLSYTQSPNMKVHDDVI